MFRKFLVVFALFSIGCVPDSGPSELTSLGPDDDPFANYPGLAGAISDLTIEVATEESGLYMNLRPTGELVYVSRPRSDEADSVYDEHTVSPLKLEEWTDPETGRNVYVWAHEVVVPLSVAEALVEAHNRAAQTESEPDSETTESDDPEAEPDEDTSVVDLFFKIGFCIKSAFNVASGFIPTLGEQGLRTIVVGAAYASAGSVFQHIPEQQPLTFKSFFDNFTASVVSNFGGDCVNAIEILKKIPKPEHPLELRIKPQDSFDK